MFRGFDYVVELISFRNVRMHYSFHTNNNNTVKKKICYRLGVVQ